MNLYIIKPKSEKEMSKIRGRLRISKTSYRILAWFIFAKLDTAYLVRYRDTELCSVRDFITAIEREL